MRTSKIIGGSDRNSLSDVVNLRKRERQVKKNPAPRWDRILFLHPSANPAKGFTGRHRVSRKK
jgi:hypothetical protein